jgi:hypothetical protein
MSAYGQSVGAVAGIFGLMVTAAAVLVGFLAVVVAATPPVDAAFDFSGELTRLLQIQAWTRAGGGVVY